MIKIINDTDVSLWSMISNEDKPICFLSLCLGNDKIIDLLIKNGANVDLPDNNQRTPLHYAAFLGNGVSPFIQLLNMFNVKEKLPYARVEWPHGVVFISPWNWNVLIERVFTMEIFCFRLFFVWLLLYTLGHEQVADLLLRSRANPNAVERDGSSPLHRAAVKGK